MQRVLNVLITFIVLINVDFVLSMQSVRTHSCVNAESSASTGDEDDQSIHAEGRRGCARRVMLGQCVVVVRGVAAEYVPCRLRGQRGTGMKL